MRFQCLFARKADLSAGARAIKRMRKRERDRVREREKGRCCDGDVAGTARPAGVKITRRDIWRHAHTRTRTCHVFYAESSRGDRGSGIESSPTLCSPVARTRRESRRSAHSKANGTALALANVLRLAVHAGANNSGVYTRAEYMKQA